MTTYTAGRQAGFYTVWPFPNRPRSLIWDDSASYPEMCEKGRWVASTNIRIERILAVVTRRFNYFIAQDCVVN